MKHSEQLNELAKALALAQAQIKGAEESGKNPHFNSRYSTLSDVWAAIRIPLTSNGLSIIQTTGIVGDKLILSTMLLHTSGQWIVGEYEINPDKRSPQGYGSAISYGKRYCLEAIVGVASADDDGNAATNKREISKPQAVPKTVTPDSPLLELADYVVPFGQKHKGKRLGDIPVEEISEFVEWLEKQKDLTPSGRAFLLIAISYLDRTVAGEKEVANGG